MGSSVQEILGFDTYLSSNDATLYSSSLPVLPHPKLTLNDLDQGHQSVDVASSSLIKPQPDIEANELLGAVENQEIESFLPDDEDELLAGIMDGFDLGGLPHRVDDLEEYDLFGSGGGLELESDPQENLSYGSSRISSSDAVASNGTALYGMSNGAVSFAGEHPLGEHPSRTLFVRNISSSVEDAELRNLFEEYGDIRTLYTACKHRGFVMISYYDIRAALTAMEALQNKSLRRRKLDIHFSIPKDNPSDKDLNQGTLVAFNLEPSVSNDDLRQIFGAYGEVKEIRETPHKKHHKFIEFYDVRAAEAALRSLNRSDIAGKRIKLEHSHPGGSRRSHVLQLNQDHENEDSRSFLHQISSSIGNSPPGNWPQFGSPLEHSPLSSVSKSPGCRSLSPTLNSNIPGLASILHPQTSNSLKLARIGKDSLRSNRVEQILSNGNSNLRNPFQLSFSFPEPRANQYSGSMSSYGASSSNGSCIETPSGPQFLWGSPKVYSEPCNSSSWRAESAGHPFASNRQKHGLPFSSRESFTTSSQGRHHLRNHVGSAPCGVNARFGHNDRGFMMILRAHNSVSITGNISENGSSRFVTMSSPGISTSFLSNGHFPAVALSVLEGFNDRRHARRGGTNGNQMDNKKQFQLDLHKIKIGEDTRTTLMIKNIPNKYTSKLLLAAIDENHRGTYDFIYLPIDFKNKCNVGYAFINMLSPLHIIPFYEAFNGKKWEKFNSEKVVSLAYARIQGSAALVAHFENSSLMNEDKRCRPILFRSEGSEYGDQVLAEHFSSNCLNIQVRRLNDEQPVNSMDSSTMQDESPSDEPKQK